MKQNMNCQEVKERLAGLAGGWLESDEEALVAAHLKECPDCQREAALDVRLIESLNAMKQPNVPAMRWEPKRTVRRTWQAAWLAPVAAAAILAVYFWPPSKTAVHIPTDEVVSSESRSLDKAHIGLSLTDAGSDPNRAILAAFAKVRSEERSQ